MAIGRESSTGAQNRDEKKDHPRSDGRHRGQDDNEHFDDPQAEQAEGKRNPHSQPGRKSGAPSKVGNPGPTDNTRPGGNRKKGSNQGALDHD
jgi:hypothetical protein